jgi:hypothetical protein
MVEPWALVANIRDATECKQAWCSGSRWLWSLWAGGKASSFPTIRKYLSALSFPNTEGIARQHWL